MCTFFPKKPLEKQTQQLSESDDDSDGEYINPHTEPAPQAQDVEEVESDESQQGDHQESSDAESDTESESDQEEQQGHGYNLRRNRQPPQHMQDYVTYTIQLM